MRNPSSYSRARVGCPSASYRTALGKLLVLAVFAALGPSVGEAQTPTRDSGGAKDSAQPATNSVERPPIIHIYREHSLAGIFSGRSFYVDAYKFANLRDGRCVDVIVPTGTHVLMSQFSGMEKIPLPLFQKPLHDLKLVASWAQNLDYYYIYSQTIIERPVYSPGFDIEYSLNQVSATEWPAAGMNCQSASVPSEAMAARDLQAPSTNAPEPGRRVMGITLVDPVEIATPSTGRPSGTAVMIGSVVSGSIAGQAGMQAGDWLKSLDGQSVGSPGDLVRARQSIKQGARVHALVVRSGQPLDLTLQF